MNAEIRFYLALLRRRLPLVVSVTGLFAALGLMVAVLLPAVYRAEALLVMESPQISGELATSTVNTAATEQLQIIQQRMLSRAHLIDLANRHRLYPDRTMDPARIVDDMRDRTRVQISSGGGQATLVRLHFDAGDPATAAEIANAYVTFMLEENIALRTGISGQTVDFFQIEMARLSEELERRSVRITEFKLANRDSLPDGQPLLRERQAALEATIADLQRARSALEAERSDYVARYERSGRVEAVVEDRYAPFLRRLNALQDELDTVVASEGGQSPRAVGLRGRIAAVERSINAQLSAEGFAGSGGAGAVHQRQLASIDDRLDEIDTEIAQRGETLTEVNDRLQESLRNAITLDSLERDHQTAREQYAQAMARAATAQTGDLIEAMSRGQRITVIEQAVPPSRKHSPRRALIAAGGAGFGLLLSLALVALLERLNQTVRRPQDLTAQLGIAPFATIPYLNSPAEAGLGRLRGTAVWVALLGGIPAALFAVHAFYLPLDLLVMRLTDSIGLAVLFDRLRP